MSNDLVLLKSTESATRAEGSIQRDGDELSWDDFERRLAGVLAQMAVETYLIISVKVTDRPNNSFVQFAQGGRAGFLAEAVSNRNLPGTLALSPAQEEQMSALGWQWPDPRSTKNLNFSREWPMPAPFDDAAHRAVRTLREVHGIEHSRELQYRSFARGGSELEQPALGIDAAPPRVPSGPDGADGPPAATPAWMETFEELGPLVERAIWEFLGERVPPRDRLGNIPIGVDGARVFVGSLDGRPPSVHVFAPVLPGAVASPALLDAVNDINTRLRFGRVIWTGRDVLAILAVPAVRITAEGIAFACLQVANIANHFGAELGARFGGAMMPAAGSAKVH